MMMIFFNEKKKPKVPDVLKVENGLSCAQNYIFLMKNGGKLPKVPPSLIYVNEGRPSRFEQITDAYTLLNLHPKADLGISGQQLQGQIAVNNLRTSGYFNKKSTNTSLTCL